MWKHERHALPSTHRLCDFSQVIGCIETSLLNRRPLSPSLLAGHPGLGLGSRCPSSPPPACLPFLGGEGGINQNRTCLSFGGRGSVSISPQGARGTGKLQYQRGNYNWRRLIHPGG